MDYKMLEKQYQELTQTKLSLENQILSLKLLIAEENDPDLKENYQKILNTLLEKCKKK